MAGSLGLVRSIVNDPRLCLPLQSSTLKSKHQSQEGLIASQSLLLMEKMEILENKLKIMQGELEQVRFGAVLGRWRVATAGCPYMTMSSPGGLAQINY